MDHYNLCGIPFALYQAHTQIERRTNPKKTGGSLYLKHEEVGKMKRALSVLAMAIACFVLAGTGAAVSAEFPGKIISVQRLPALSDLGYKVKNHDSSRLGWDKDGTLPVEK
jgi:hypothetical protein